MLLIKQHWMIVTLIGLLVGCGQRGGETIVVAPISEEEIADQEKSLDSNTEEGSKESSVGSSANGKEFLDRWKGLKDQNSADGKWSAVSINAQDGTAMDSYDGSIRISLAHPFDAAKDDYELAFAVSNNKVKHLGVCVVKKTPECQFKGDGFFESKVIDSNNDVIFFKTEKSALLEDGLVIDVIAADDAGKILEKRRLKITK